ncbi:hypothetical protein DFH07DRAFT_969885 [Mycena maculata]|uniref:Uncharacterized protein n=1 Tax=Mycena maculata TaxID=230809 RepID=A0AAD7HVH1_9AGAR|nr:hypothetical protein DFH07DRAFT_969885 [Mycena maculata]
MAGQEGKRWEPVQGEWVFKGRMENNGWLRRRGHWWHVIFLRANLWSSGIAIVCWVYPTFAPGTQNPKILQAMSAPQPRRSVQRLAAVSEVAPSEAEVARATRVARRHAEQPEPAPPVKPRKKAAQANSGKDPAAPARKRQPPKKKSKVKHEAAEETDTDPRPEATEARTDALEDGANTDGAGEDECSEDAQEEGANEDEICEHEFHKGEPELHGHASVVHEDESTADAQEEDANEDDMREEDVRTDAPEAGAHASVVDEDESTADAQEEGTNEDDMREDEVRKDTLEERAHACVVHEVSLPTRFSVLCSQEEGANEDDMREDEVRKDTPEERAHACVVHEDESTADAQDEGTNEDKICEHKFRKDEPEPRGHAGVIHEDKSGKNAPVPPAGAPRTATGRLPAKATVGAILSSEALAFFSAGRTGGRQPRPSAEQEDMDGSDTDNVPAAGPNTVAATHRDNPLNRFKPRGFVPRDRPAKLHQFIAASTTKVEDGEDGYSSDDGSDYSITEVAAQKEKECHNRLACHQTFVPLIEDCEEQDERDTRAMEEEMANRGRKWGKSEALRSRSSAKKAGPLRGEDSEDGEDGEDSECGDSSEDGDGSEDEETRQRNGKKESTLYKAVGQDPTRGRTVNSWNVFQAKFRVENRQLKTSNADFTKQARAAYKRLFEELPEDVSEKMSVVMDARKEKGGSLAMLNKVVQLFIRQSTLAHQNNNVDIFGLGIDTYGDQAVIWGGSPNFLSVHDTYLPAIKVKLVDIKAIMINMVNREEAASAAAPQPIPISFGKGENEKSCRDGRRRVFAPLMLSMIHLVLLERERKSKTPIPTGLKMSWKWADLAVRLRVRIENWPEELKSTFPSASFTVWSIKGTTANKAFQTMLEDLENRYCGKEGAEGGMNIVSWTDDEIQLDDDNDIDVGEVPIVTCSDGTTLLYTSDSKKLLKRLGGAKGKGKAKAVGGNESDEGPEEDEGEDDTVHDATATNSAKAGSKQQSAGGDDLLPAKRQHIRQPQASTSRFQPTTSTSTSAVFAQVMRFRYIKGEVMSGEFKGHVRQFVGPSSKIHKATQVYVETGDQVGNWKWIALPAPLISREICETSNFMNA